MTSTAPLLRPFMSPPWKTKSLRLSSFRPSGWTKTIVSVWTKAIGSSSKTRATFDPSGETARLTSWMGGLQAAVVSPIKQASKQVRGMRMRGPWGRRAS
jgi:hypothetical protein